MSYDLIYDTLRFDMSQDTTASKKARGRPPSKEARAKALDAAHDILMREGFGRLTIEAVAARSGVGKATIYRNWGNACELAMVALMAGMPAENTDAARTLNDGLRRQMRSLVQAFATTRGRQIAMTLAAADPESEFTKAFRNQVILSSREAGKAMIQQAISRSEMEMNGDIEVLLDMIYGPVFYRLLVGHKPLSRKFADGVVAAAIKLLNR